MSNIIRKLVTTVASRSSIFRYIVIGRMWKCSLQDKMVPNFIDIEDKPLSGSCDSFHFGFYGPKLELLPLSWPHQIFAIVHYMQAPSMLG